MMLTVEPTLRPRVSIVLPTFNQANYLRFALDSIFRQTFRDFELIVVNDGSTDDTRDVLNSYLRHHDFIVIDQENRKLPRALNTGFRRATGEYLTWTSSDNILLPDMLEVLVEALDSNPDIGMVYADWEIIDEQGRIVEQVETLDYDPDLLMRLNFVNACFLYRRACQERVGLYDHDYMYVEDWEYWHRISQHFEMLRVPKVLYQYRTHRDSLTEKVVKAPAREGATAGYQRLRERFRSNIWSWYISKLKLEWQRRKHREARLS